MLYSFSKEAISFPIRDKKMRCSTKASTVSAILSSFLEACCRRETFVNRFIKKKAMPAPKYQNGLCNIKEFGVYI